MTRKACRCYTDLPDCTDPSNHCKAQIEVTTTGARVTNTCWREKLAEVLARFDAQVQLNQIEGIVK